MKSREFVKGRNEEEDVIFEVHMGNGCDLKSFFGCQHGISEFKTHILEKCSYPLLFTTRNILLRDQ
jgi:hypothetical protein